MTQRADASHNIGKLKSKAAYRSLRLAALVLNALREWKLACPKGDLDLVFPNGLGKVESYANLVDRGFYPIQVSAGVVTLVPVTGDDGKQVINNAGRRSCGRSVGTACTPTACLRLAVDRARA